MSLAEQSQQWFPTSVQVTVHQARNLRVKGKNGTNDAYAIIQVAKDKFSTSVAEKSAAPVWKEEAAFDLPLFHPGNAERCTLFVIVMHRAQAGLDKFLGQAVVNLLDLHDNKSRKKTDWFKLVDKSGKEDKARGEVLLDIHFMRNNLSASMFDLSMQDKPRSRLSKLKDKVRGKKKDGFSDSASAIVPPVSQVLTDSEGEPDSISLNQTPGEKKKSKFKKLFAPKSNLQRNTSQSMSTLGSLPEKNSSLSGSRSSGLNVDSPEVKKKFKFLGHKRTGSSDSRVSQGPFSLLGRSKHSTSDLNNLCINGNHVYAEEGDPKSGSTPSLNSSGQGSVEDVQKHTSDFSEESFRSTPAPSYRQESLAVSEQQRHQEDEERKQAEARRSAEAKKLEEEEKYRAEEERRRLEQQRQEEQAQKGQEEASMSERLSSLFGMIRKKEDKKEVAQQHSEEDLPSQDPPTDAREPDQSVSHRSTNPFIDVPLISDTPASTDGGPADTSSLSPPVSSAMVFLNRATKVSKVKPSQQCPSPAASESTLSSVPSESPETFSSLHSSLAPPHLSPSLTISSTENIPSVESSAIMYDSRRKALPPLYETQNGENNRAPARENRNSGYVEAGGSQQVKKGALPLPDYETLFPQRRHGVQGQTRWDHIIAEVNQRNRDAPPVLLGPEMSVDGPEEQELKLHTELLSKDPWAQVNQSQEIDGLFTSSVRKEKKPEDRGMTTNDLDEIFSQDISSDPFASFNDNDNGEQISQRSRVNNSEQSPAFQRRNSQRWKRHSVTDSEKAPKSWQERAYEEETATAAANQCIPARDVMSEFITPKKPADTKKQTNVSGEENSFSSEYFTAPSTFDSSDSLQVIMEEPASQAGVLSGGKPPLRAWVSPSEVQPISAQNSNGGGLAVTSRRPHPVKPMNSLESQHFISTPAVKDVKVHGSTPAKIALSDSAGSGPYTQLTQEELITLVVKQQADLSRKDAKIVELEEYIDKLLVRVIEEKPTILQALNSAKPV
ncbi:uncharacterized protein LOC144739762 [Lampetra planeri]